MPSTQLEHAIEKMSIKLFRKALAEKEQFSSLDKKYLAKICNYPKKHVSRQFLDTAYKASAANGDAVAIEWFLTIDRYPRFNLMMDCNYALRMVVNNSSEPTEQSDYALTARLLMDDDRIKLHRANKKCLVPFEQAIARNLPQMAIAIRNAHHRRLQQRGKRDTFDTFANKKILRLACTTNNLELAISIFKQLPVNTQKNGQFMARLMRVALHNRAERILNHFMGTQQYFVEKQQQLSKMRAIFPRLTDVDYTIRKGYYKILSIFFEQSPKLMSTILESNSFEACFAEAARKLTPPILLTLYRGCYVLGCLFPLTYTSNRPLTYDSTIHFLPILTSMRDPMQCSIGRHTLPNQSFVLCDFNSYSIYIYPPNSNVILHSFKYPETLGGDRNPFTMYKAIARQRDRDEMLVAGYYRREIGAQKVLRKVVCRYYSPLLKNV